MSWEIVFIALQIIGGAGLLLYGIEVMKDSLESFTENRTLHLLEASGKSTVRSIFAGFLVTLINQKSTSTTVMVVGLVNAGIMELIPAAGVIMGANIGTTITAQLLAFRLEALAPCIVGLAVFFWRYGKKKKIEEFSGIFMGAGLMFIGLIFIETAIFPLRKLAAVQAYMAWSAHLSAGGFLLFLLVGFLLTGILRSSSVIAGIMIAMAAQQLLSLDAGLAMILGINVGKCLTAMLAARGATRTGKRAAVIHLLFNAFGAVLVTLFLRHAFVRLLLALSPANPGRQIANAHTLFNLGTTIICLPFVRKLVSISGKLVPVNRDESIGDTPALDARMLETPNLALAQSNDEIAVMAGLACSLYDSGFKAVQLGAEKYARRVREEESTILRLQKDIEIYLVKLSGRDITENQRHRLKLMMGVTGDVERISDTAFTIAKLAAFKIKNSIHLSKDAVAELEELHGQIMAMADEMVPAIRQGDTETANRLLSAAIKLRNSEEALQEAHVDRLNQGVCSPGSGVLFLDLIGHMEQAVNYMSRICCYIIENDKY